MDLTSDVISTRRTPAAALARARGYYEQAIELRRQAELASLAERRKLLLDAASRLITLAQIEVRGLVPPAARAG